MSFLAAHQRRAPAANPTGPPKIAEPMRVRKSGWTALLVQNMTAAPTTAAVASVSAPSVAATAARRSNAMTPASSAATAIPRVTGPGSGGAKADTVTAGAVGGTRLSRVTEWAGRAVIAMMRRPELVDVGTTVLPHPLMVRAVR